MCKDIDEKLFIYKEIIESLVERNLELIQENLEYKRTLNTFKRLDELFILTDNQIVDVKI